MAIDPQRFKAPYLENTQCWDAAEIFRHRYWPSGALPVDVLDIAEFDLGLKFKMVSGLREDADVDALLLGCHGSVQNQPLRIESKPATLRQVCS